MHGPQDLTSETCNYDSLDPPPLGPLAFHKNKFRRLQGIAMLAFRNDPLLPTVLSWDISCASCAGLAEYRKQYLTPYSSTMYSWIRPL